MRDDVYQRRIGPRRGELSEADVKRLQDQADAFVEALPPMSEQREQPSRCWSPRCNREAKWIVRGEPDEPRARRDSCSNHLAAHVGYFLEHGHTYCVVEPLGDAQWGSQS